MKKQRADVAVSLTPITITNGSTLPSLSAEAVAIAAIASARAVIAAMLLQSMRFDETLIHI